MIAFRSMLPPDRQFVVSGWSSSYRKSDYAGMIHDDDWPDVMHRQIKRMLDRPDMQTIVAHETTAKPGVADLLGFITADPKRSPPVVAYVYVKSSYRRGGRGRLWTGDGLGRQLFAAIGVDPKLPFEFVCNTVFVDELARHIPHATFKPVLGRKDRAA